MKSHQSLPRSWIFYVFNFFWLALGAFLAAVAVKVFLAPNNLIDGGIVGASMIGAYLFGPKYLSFLYIALNLPFLYLAYKLIGKTFVIQMCLAVLMFAGFAFLLEDVTPFHGESLEIIFLAGVALGAGSGLVIRKGASLDGTEILAIIINRKRGFTVGQVILFINIFIFAAAGIIYQDWHTALQSLMIYIVASKVMDTVIVGFEETKSVIVVSAESKKIADAVMSELGIGLTILYGKRGYSQSEQEILYIIVERLQLAELKEIVHREDLSAFIAVENLHEVINGRINVSHKTKLLRKRLKHEALKS
ncbi:MAG: YitT family protein [Chlamydiales bacterium]|nr:YitT family protein [Chlamydiales bacterium]